MKNSRLEEYIDIEENIIKDVKSLFRLKKLKKKQMTLIKGITNLFKLKKKIKQIKTK